MATPPWKARSVARPLAPPPPRPASVRGKAFWTAGQQSLRYPKAPHQTEILQRLQKSLWLASSETIAALWTNKSPQSVAMAGYFRKPIQCQICSFYHIFIIADDGIILPDQLTIQIFDEPTLSLLSFGRSLFIMVDDDHLRKTSYSADFQNWGRALNFGKLVNQAPRPKTNAISLWCSFPKLRACPQFRKSGQPATPSKEKCFFEGVKPKKNQPNFFCSFLIHIKNTFCKKNGQKRIFQPSAVAWIIYIRLYGVATTN